MKDNIMSINYHRTGVSTNTNSLGMREMQARVYKKRNSKYLLVKAPPASGKSRALMFVGLDKLNNQGIKKIIVAVPERAIGKSFKSTKLSKNGFYYDWNVNPYYDLTTFGETNRSITNHFIEFLNDPKAKILLCTHSTLRNVYKDIDDDAKFDNTMVAIDEFHHIEANNSLGYVLKHIIHNSTAHILAMTGSYFRGDSQPILTDEDEKMFDEVNYTYYEQLNGYKYLKSFGIDYKFYQGKYLDAIGKALDTTKKTIIHIPNINSTESTKDKEREVGVIEDTIGDFIKKDSKSGIDYIKRHSDNKILKVADLVTEEHRDRVQTYLCNISSENDLDIIIALGLAKEGFDWPWAENALTIGYRGSLTEIVQIIGRITRDSPNKSHAEFTNLIAKPNANDIDITTTVNTIIKAITSSLLMEQVLKPELKIKSRNRYNTSQNNNDDDQIIIKGFKEPSTDKTRNIINNDLPDLKAAILQDKDVQEAIAKKSSPGVINKDLIPKVIREQNPDLSTEEVDEIRQYTIADMAMKQSNSEKSKDSLGNTQQFLHMADKIVNVDNLDINLIDSINPFQKAYQIMSNNIDSSTLRIIQQTIDAKKINFSKEELIELYPRICDFVDKKGYPNKHSSNELEVRYAYALSALRDMKLRRMNGENYE